MTRIKYLYVIEKIQIEMDLDRINKAYCIIQQDF